MIIPCRDIDLYARECLWHCKSLDYDDYEIIVLPDYTQEDLGGVKVIPTGPITPGAKRNIGVANSKGELCAFTDSDAYPRCDWLRNGIKYFEDPMVGAVGGPGLTPEDDSPRQKASGYVTSSFMVGGLSRRYKTKGLREVDDIHSCNFIARRKVLEEVGGWNEDYWPGEDTLMCLAIRRAGYKILEASDVVVYHHRRPLFKQHLMQVSRFGMHRGFFAKRFGGNSMHLTYFMPSITLIGLVAIGFLTVITDLVSILLFALIGIYLATAFMAAMQETRDGRIIPMVWVGIVLTHLTYGVFFIAGLIRPELEM
ncbi:MAG: glycosyltransferase [Candidatus Bathyarchaeia archaeon]